MLLCSPIPQCKETHQDQNSTGKTHLQSTSPMHPKSHLQALHSCTFRQSCSSTRNPTEQNYSSCEEPKASSISLRHTQPLQRVRVLSWVSLWQDNHLTLPFCKTQARLLPLHLQKAHPHFPLLIPKSTFLSPPSQHRNPSHSQPKPSPHCFSLILLPP